MVIHQHPKSVAKGCVMKKKFLSESHAEIIMKRNNKYQRAYKCPSCKNWHITTQRPRPMRYVVHFDFNQRFDDLKEELFKYIDQLYEDNSPE